MKCASWIGKAAEHTPKQVAILYLVTFFVFLPVLCRNLRHSLYHIRSRNLDEENRLMTENDQRLAKMQPIIKKYNQSVFQNSQSGPSLHSENVDVGITVITVSRNRHEQRGRNTRYLTQVVGRLLDLLNTTTKTSRKKYGLFLCNVDADPNSFDEIKPLKILLPTFQKFQRKHRSIIGIFEKEKQDYVFCLEETLRRNVSYAFLVEDDGYPNKDLMPVLETVIDSRLQPRGESVLSPIPSRNVTYVKFYHPERLLGYISLEWERLPELIAVSFVFGTFFTLLFMNFLVDWKRNNLQLIWLLFVFYCCLVALAVGRVNLLEMRRISTQTYQITPAASCCTPAMLFPKDGGMKIVKQLKQVTCRLRYGKDMALEDIRRQRRLTALMVQPNLFKHIGLVSSLRSGEVDPFFI